MKTGQEKGPGPGDHKIPEMIGPNRSKQYKTKSPDYVMGQRFKYNTYDNFARLDMLPEVMGAAAKNVYSNKPPTYSMYITNKKPIIFFLLTLISFKGC